MDVEEVIRRARLWLKHHGDLPACPQRDALVWMVFDRALERLGEAAAELAIVQSSDEKAAIVDRLIRDISSRSFSIGSIATEPFADRRRELREAHRD